MEPVIFTYSLFLIPYPRPSNHQSAVDGQHLAGDEVGVDKIGHGLDDIRRKAVAAQGGLLPQRLHGVRVHRGHHVGQDHAGGDGVDPDARRGQLLGQCLGHGDDGPLAGRVADLAGGPHLSPHGGQIDDAPGLVAEHPRQHRVDAVVDAVYIDGEEPVPGLLADLIDKTVVGDGGVVDQHVHRPEVPESRAHGFRVGHVAEDGLSAGLPGQSFCLRPAAVVEKPDPMALGGEIPDGFCADSPAAACD